MWTQLTMAKTQWEHVSVQTPYHSPGESRDTQARHTITRAGTDPTGPHNTQTHTHTNTHIHTLTHSHTHTNLRTDIHSPYTHRTHRLQEHSHTYTDNHTHTSTS